MGCVDRLLADSDHHPYISRHRRGVYAPDDSVTREQVMAILYRYAAAQGTVKDSKADAEEYSFSDWAKPYISWARENGILAIGTEISDLTESASRAEIAAYLTRLYQSGIVK